MSFNEKAVALIFEVTHGCQYNCSGCTVNKESSTLPDKTGFDKIIAFLDNLESNDITLSELEVGPTDILSSLNKNEVLTHPIFISMVNRFQLLTLIVGLIMPKEETYIELADQINSITDSVDIGIVTPMELTHVNNEKYLRTIERNVQLLKSHLKAPLVEIILQVNFDARFLTQRQLGMPSYDALFDRIHFLNMPVQTKVNYTLPHGRSKLETELVSGNFLDSIKALNTFYIRDMKRRGNNIQKRHIPFQLLNPRHSGEVLWHDNELYVRPVINERFTFLNESRRFSEPWTYDNLIETSLEFTNKSLEKGLQFNDCVNCEHLMTCANRGVHEVMDITGATECIMLLKEYGYLSTPLQNGDYDKINWNFL